MTRCIACLCRSRSVSYIICFLSSDLQLRLASSFWRNRRSWLKRRELAMVAGRRTGRLM